MTNDFNLKHKSFKLLAILHIINHLSVFLAFKMRFINLGLMSELHIFLFLDVFMWFYCFMHSYI